MNSNFPPSHATDPRGDVVQTKSPEVSPRAREAAEKELQRWLSIWPNTFLGEHVQRALDAAVEERAKGEPCDVCGGSGQLQHAKCACNGTGKMAIAITSIREALFDVTKEATEAKLEVAALRQKLEHTERELHEHSVFWSARDFSGEIQHYKAIPSEAAHVIESLSISADSLRAQLASVTSERDLAVRELTDAGWTHEIGAERWKPPVNHAIGELWQRLVFIEHERDELQRKLAAAEQERDDARRCKPDEFSHVLASERAARSELSSLRKVYLETAEERDTLAHRVAELEKELHGIRVMLQAGERDLCEVIGERMTTRTNELHARVVLEARCEKLEQSLLAANANHEKFERLWYLEQDRREKLEKALGLSLLPLAVLKITDQVKPYDVICTDLREQIIAGHDALIAALNEEKSE